MRPRFSISRMMALVLIIAVGLGAAVAGAFAFATVMLSAASLGALVRQGRSQAFFLGCAVCGWTSMFLAFGSSQELRAKLPTNRPILNLIEVINGPGPTTFKSPDAAGRWVIETVESANRIVVVGHSVISLALALAGGIVLWLIATWRMRGKEGKRPPNHVSSPIH